VTAIARQRAAGSREDLLRAFSTRRVHINLEIVMHSKTAVCVRDNSREPITTPIVASSESRLKCKGDGSLRPK